VPMKSKNGAIERVVRKATSMTAKALFVVVACPTVACGDTPEPLIVTPGAVTLGRVTTQVFSASQRVARWSVQPDGGAITDTGEYTSPDAEGVFHVFAETASGGIAQATVTVITRDLQDFGGPVLASPVAHIIFWGDIKALPPDLPDAVASFFNHVDGSAYLGTTTQYLRGGQPSVTYAGALFDFSASPPSKTPSAVEVADEVCAVLNAHGVSVAPDDVFVVYGSTPVTSDPLAGAFCGWHSYVGCQGQRIVVDFIGTPASSGGNCISVSQPTCGLWSAAAAGIVATTAHELLESITDPEPGVAQAWLEPNGSEIADKCGSEAQQCVQLTDGSSVLVPPMFSNATHSCVFQ
jgi:hypothetical protein